MWFHYIMKNDEARIVSESDELVHRRGFNLKESFLFKGIAATLVEHADRIRNTLVMTTCKSDVAECDALPVEKKVSQLSFKKACHET